MSARTLFENNGNIVQYRKDNNDLPEISAETDTETLYSY